MHADTEAWGQRGYPWHLPLLVAVIEWDDVGEVRCSAWSLTLSGHLLNGRGHSSFGAGREESAGMCYQALG